MGWLLIRIFRAPTQRKRFRAPAQRKRSCASTQRKRFLLLSEVEVVRMSELRFAGVTITYGSGRHAHVAVDAVDLVVPSGQVVGLVGESGSGKSTLARAAVGLVAPAAGKILLDGKPVPRRGRRPLQMVFQDPYASLDPRMTAGESIAEAIPRRADRVQPAGRGGAAHRARRAAARAPSTSSPRSCPAGSGSGSRSPGPWPGAPT